MPPRCSPRRAPLPWSPAPWRRQGWQRPRLPGFRQARSLPCAARRPARGLRSPCPRCLPSSSFTMTRRSRMRMVPASTSAGQLSRHLPGEVRNAGQGTRRPGSQPVPVCRLSVVRPSCSRALCGTSDDVDQRAEDRNEQDEDGPPSLCQAVVVLPAEVVDEAPDYEKDHQEDAGKNRASSRTGSTGEMNMRTGSLSVPLRPPSVDSALVVITQPDDLDGTHHPLRGDLKVSAVRVGVELLASRWSGVRPNGPGGKC